MIGSHWVAPPAGTEPCSRPDVPDEGVVDHDREVARHLQLVAAADGDPVHAGDGRLADLPQPVVHVHERAEPLPVLLRVAEQILAPRAQVGADAERPARTGDDDDADLVVPGRVLEGARQLAEHPEVEGVQHLRPVERHRRARIRLLVDDPLEAELLRGERARLVGLGHATSAKVTVNGMPISIASLPLAANSSDLTAVLNASMSSHSNSA